jgi:D-inositol-3-phosphate glycosyltransferase
MTSADSGATGVRPLRTMLVSHYFDPHVGGIETVIRSQAVGLSKMGWHVDVHTSRVPRSAPTRERYGAFDVHRHAALNPLESRLRVPVPIPLPGTTASLANSVEGIDVVVIHGHVYPIGLAAARAARRAGIPYVVVQHSPWVDYPWPLSTVERLADGSIGRRLLEHASVVVCVSKFTESFVRSIAPKSRTTVVPNGVDTSVFKPDDTPTSLASHLPTVVTVRRLVPRAGVDLLIDAWRAASLDDVGSLVIGGSGPESDHLRERAADLRNVSFAGFVPDADLASTYRNATVAVMPTRSGEGFGLMAAEALACGTPVVVTAQGALPEVVRDGIDGLVVAENDAAALGSAIRSILMDQSLAARLRSGARTTNWSWHSSIERFSNVLTKVVSTSRSPELTTFGLTTPTAGL